MSKSLDIELWLTRLLHEEPELWFDQQGEALYEDLAWLAADFWGPDLSVEDALKIAEKAVGRFLSEQHLRKSTFDHFSQDNYYRRGQFNVLLDIEPLSGELDEDARRRALQQLLYALQDETGLKISSFVDVYDEVAEEIEEVPEGVMEEDLEDEFVEAAVEGDPNKATAEFVVYNKLGVSALGKLKRFTDNHIRGDLTPQIVLVDPVTKKKFRTTKYRIQYLFHYFIAGQPPDDWARLKELVSQEDRGYRELIRKGDTMYHNAGHVVYDFDVDAIAEAIKTEAIPAIVKNPESHIGEDIDYFVYELEELSPYGYGNLDILANILEIPKSVYQRAVDKGNDIELIIEQEEEVAGVINGALPVIGVGHIAFGTFNPGDSSWGLYYVVGVDELANYTEMSPMPAELDVRGK